MRASLDADPWPCLVSGSALRDRSPKRRRRGMPSESPSTGLSPAGNEARVVLVSERLAVQIGGRAIPVTPTQFRLLAVLAGEPGRTFTRTELVERGIGTLVTERTVDVHIKELRRKIGPGLHIETVRGVGYRYRGNPVSSDLQQPG